SNASRRPSPKKLMLSTVNRINMPGKNQSQGAESRYFADLSSILPQLAVGSCTPSPRKLIYDSERIAFATLNVDETMIGAIVFGKICKKMISELDVPVARAARMNSRSFQDRNSARTMRARYIQLVAPIIATMT